MISCSVRIECNTAKRLLEFSGECNRLHGYRLGIEATFRSRNDSATMVMDFAELKEILGGWLAENWEHNVILNKKDNALGTAIEGITGQKIFYMQGEPTAENLALYLKEEICPAILPDDVECSKIRIYDTEDCYVEAV